MDNYDGKIDEMYLVHDNPELKGKSECEIHERLLGFPEEDEGCLGSKNKSIDIIINSTSI
jgi:hypothetical protein